jgi:hypothetical protein
VDERVIPSQLDLAKVLESSTQSHPRPEALPTLLWLIRQSPSATALYEELHRDSGDQPTLMDLAKLLGSFSEGPHPECRHTALWLVRQCEAGREAITDLEQLARDAGVLPFEGSRSLVDVLQRHLEVDQLLGAPDWDDPMDVVDPRRERFLPFYGECISILSARLGRSRQAGVSQRLRDVLAKVRRCVERDDRRPTR